MENNLTIFMIEFNSDELQHIKDLIMVEIEMCCDTILNMDPEEDIDQYYGWIIKYIFARDMGKRIGVVSEWATEELEPSIIDGL